MVPNGYQNQANVFNEIDTNAAIIVGDKPARRTTFLQNIHKRIAIQKITAYLAAGPVINANALPQRTATGAGALAHVNNNEYQQYANFIRTAAYNEGQINAFVREITAVIAAQKAMPQITA